MSRRRRMQAGRFAALAGDFWRNPERHRLSPAAQALYCAALSYAADQLTDGFVPSYMLPALVAGDPGGAPVELVALEWWAAVEGGFVAVGWEKYNPTAAEIEENSRKQRERADRRWNAERDADAHAAGNADGISEGISEGRQAIAPDARPIAAVGRGGRENPAKTASGNAAGNASGTCHDDQAITPFGAGRARSDDRPAYATGSAAGNAPPDPRPQKIKRASHATRARGPPATRVTPKDSGGRCAEATPSGTAPRPSARPRKPGSPARSGTRSAPSSSGDAPARLRPWSRSERSMRSLPVRQRGG